MATDAFHGLVRHLQFGHPKRAWDFRSPGRGEVDFESVIRALNRAKYSGPLSVEWEDPDMAREHGAAEAVDFVKGLQFPAAGSAFDDGSNTTDGRMSWASAEAWAASLEYRFPIALFNRGLGAWPLHFDRMVGAAFVDAGDAWSPYPRRGAIASSGAEVSLSLLTWFNEPIILRTGFAVPWTDGVDPQVYVRVGLPF